MDEADTMTWSDTMVWACEDVDKMTFSQFQLGFHLYTYLALTRMEDSDSCIYYISFRLLKAFYMGLLLKAILKASVFLMLVDY